MSHSIYVREMQLSPYSIITYSIASLIPYICVSCNQFFCCICSHACSVSFHICARVATKSAQVALNSIVSFHTHARVATVMLIKDDNYYFSLISHTRASCNNKRSNLQNPHVRLISHTRASCNGRNCANFTAPLFSFCRICSHIFVWNGALATYGARFLVRTFQYFYVHFQFAPGL